METDKSVRFRRKPGKRPLVLAHRGARRDAPENTLLAFRTALEQGADGVELDVRMCADGELFVHHDEVVATESAMSAPIGRLTTSQVRQLKTRSGQPVPTLADVLLFAARTGALLNVELKGDGFAPLTMAKRAAAQIARHGGAGVLLSSFSPLQVGVLARRLPHVPVALLLHAEQTLARHCGLPRLLGAIGVHPELAMTTREYVLARKAQGLLVNVWTVNEPKDAELLSEIGVDAIITDVPRTIRSTLAN